MLEPDLCAMKLQSIIAEEGQKAGDTYKTLLGEWLFRENGKDSLDKFKVFFHDKLSVFHRHGCQQESVRIFLYVRVKDSRVGGNFAEKHGIVNVRLRLQTGPAASHSPCQTLSDAARQCKKCRRLTLRGHPPDMSNRSTVGTERGTRSKRTLYIRSQRSCDPPEHNRDGRHWREPVLGLAKTVRAIGTDAARDDREWRERMARVSTAKIARGREKTTVPSVGRTTARLPTEKAARTSLRLTQDKRWQDCQRRSID